jgi:hypothetical protein
MSIEWVDDLHISWLLCHLHLPSTPWSHSTLLSELIALMSCVFMGDGFHDDELVLHWAKSREPSNADDGHDEGDHNDQNAYHDQPNHDDQTW